MALTDHWYVLIIASVIIIAYLYMIRKFKYWQNRGILELSPIPFFGNFAECLFLRRAPADFLKDLYVRAKGLPYVGFYVFDKPFLLICDRELIRKVLIKDMDHFANRYNNVSPNDRLGYANLFFLEYPIWKILKTKLTPFFSSKKLKEMFHLILECGNNLENYLESLGLEGKGKMIEIRETLVKFTTDVIGSTAYGIDCNSFKDPNAQFYKCAKTISSSNLICVYKLLAIFFLPNLTRIMNVQAFSKEVTVFLRTVFRKTFTERIKSNVKRNDLIDILIDLKRTHGDQDIEGFKFDGDDLLSQAASFFIGGADTTPLSMVFVLYQIALNPEVQTKLRKEILDALDETNGEMTYDMITSLTYLDMVIAESLRMNSPLEYLNRVTTKTYKIPNSDLVIEKGTPIYISSLGMHYDPEYYPNPNKFDPERFTDENKRNRPSGVYYPFGDGPHMCIGIRFALLQIKLVISKILTKFEVAPCEKTLIPMMIDHRVAFTVPLNGVTHLNFRAINNKT